MISLGLLLAASFDAVSIAQTGAALNALGPHPFGSPRNQAAAQFLAAKLKEVGLAETVVDDFTSESGTGANVVAHVPGRSDRIVIVATHHDTSKDGLDLAARSRSLATLVEIARQTTRQVPAKTWILASFDGGASAGEGFAHYLGSMGRSRDLIDGVIVLDAASTPPSEPKPAIIAPACQSGSTRDKRLASRDFLGAALGGIPAETDYSFDDPGIGLLTQPFLRTFRTRCDPMTSRAIEANLNAVLVSETPYSRRLLAGAIDVTKPGNTIAKDVSAASLGELTLAAAMGVDATPIAQPQSDSWLVVGSSVWPGWLLFLIGFLSLVPGLFSLRQRPPVLGMRAAYSLVFLIGLYVEPEVALFAGLLPNLVPASTPRFALLPALLPLGLLIVAGLLGFARGSVEGSWVSLWFWGGVLLAIGLLAASWGRGGSKRSTAKSKARKK